ncbi:hypothetical protein LCGC14_2238510 [marine sediment metagenome]|uniref:Uncharacterized protein n=1 Tax=marine sediment metagenome TaxID=412755 RepID=A0A0F9G163_9ZZZZ
MPTVDLTGVETNAFAALPRGRYRVVVDRPPEIRISGSSGNEGAFWLFRVSDVLNTNPVIEDPTTVIDRTIPHNTSFTIQSLWNLKRTLVALGEDPEVLEGELEVSEDYLAKFEGREAIVSVTQREYQGEMQNNIQNIRALSEEEAGALA